MQWIKHLRICRIRGIACSWGNYFLSRRKICKGHIFRHQMLFFTLPAEAQSNNILRFLRMLRLVLFLLKSPSLGGGTGGRYATNFGRSKKKKKKIQVMVMPSEVREYASFSFCSWHSFMTCIEGIFLSEAIFKNSSDLSKKFIPHAMHRQWKGTTEGCCWGEHLANIMVAFNSDYQAVGHMINEQSILSTCFSVVFQRFM